MDKKAKKILFSSYWKNGWLNDDDRYTSPEDFEYAKSKGLMFDPFTINHDECIKEIFKLKESISKVKIARAFLSSLKSRRLDWRSALASYALAKKIPAHSYEKYNYSDEECPSYTCGICDRAEYGISGNEKYINEDINVLNFERIKWGGVRHGDILYTLLDLREFCKADIPEPSKDDIACFKNILQVIESSDNEDYPSTLEKRLSDAVKSNKSERQVLIEILASIGVLEPQSYDRPIRGKNDWVFVEYWRGEDKYQSDVVNNYFGKYL